MSGLFSLIFIPICQIINWSNIKASEKWGRPFMEFSLPYVKYDLSIIFTHANPWAHHTNLAIYKDIMPFFKFDCKIWNAYEYVGIICSKQFKAKTKVSTHASISVYVTKFFLNKKKDAHVAKHCQWTCRHM